MENLIYTSATFLRTEQEQVTKSNGACYKAACAIVSVHLFFRGTIATFQEKQSSVIDAVGTSILFDAAGEPLSALRGKYDVLEAESKRKSVLIASLERENKRLKESKK